MAIEGQCRGPIRVVRCVLACARVVCLLACIQVCGVWFFAHQARASVETALDHVASWLKNLEGVSTNQPTALWINGVKLWLASGRSSLKPSALLDHFENFCNGKSGIDLAPLTLNDAQRAALSRPIGLPNSHGVFRLQNADRGIVACLDSRGSPINPATLLQKAQRFLETGDLFALGELRYFLVQPSEGDTSAFLSAWSQGSAKILQLFPERGDAPGEDLPGPPRPNNSRRVLSAGVPGMGSLASYVIAEEASAALDHYRAQLEGAGWQVRKLPDSLSLLANQARGTILVTSSSSSAARPGGSNLTLSAL